MRVLIIRWFFILGFMFQVLASVFMVIVLTRMRREWLIAMTLLNIMVARNGVPATMNGIQKSGGVDEMHADPSR